jgi:hypothetical protein
MLGGAVTGVIFGVLCLGLAGCAGGEAPPGLTLTATSESANETIHVHVSGLRPAERVQRVRLVAPDGARFGPEERTRHRRVRATHGQPTVGVQARGGSASGIEPGLTLSFDLFDWAWGGSKTVRRHGVTAVFAMPPGYADAPGDWRVEAVVADPTGQRRTRRAPVTAD